MYARRVKHCARVIVAALLVGMPLWWSIFAPSARADELPSWPDGLDGFVDDFVAKEMKSCGAPGVAVAIVKDGAVVLTRGYGLANLEDQVPVDVNQTLFRIASVTKSVTATAVMQMVEQGKLDLKADVNDTLQSFRIPATFESPVTLASLLTHTSGLDKTFIGCGVPEGGKVSLGDHMAARARRRFMAPGLAFAYNNHNYTLAGHLVELASGQTYDQYVAANIFEPLGMHKSGFSLAGEELAKLAHSYKRDGGGLKRWPRLPEMHDLPAGGMFSTAPDMAKFMLAHLGQGGTGGTRIFSQESARLMHQRQFAHHRGLLDGVTYGFVEDVDKGRRAIASEGHMAGYFSLVYLVPEQNLGIFVTSNLAADGCNIVWGLPYALLDRYYPGEDSVSSPLQSDDFARRTSQLAGTYRSIGHSWFTFEKLGALGGMAREVEVRVIGDGAISVDGSRYVEIEPLLFEREDGKRRVAFGVETFAREAWMSDGIGLYELVRWHGNSTLHRVLFGACMLIFITVVFGWPMGRVIRRLRQKPRSSTGAARWASIVGWLAAALNLAFVLGLIAAFAGPWGPFWVGFGIPTSFEILLTMPLLAGAAIPAIVTFTALAWRGRYWSIFGRIHYTALAFFSVVWVWFLSYWNLLGFNY